MPKRINDGLTKYQRYRLKDLEGYRKRKREYARTPEERKKRTEYMRVWKSKNRERANELARQSHARNKWKHVERARNYHLRRSYGITQHDFENLLKEQNGVCKICKVFTKRRLHVDHDHKNGRVRGLLCTSCNNKIGWYEKHSKDVIKYLKLYKSIT
jgi:hypothetical protein